MIAFLNGILAGKTLTAAYIDVNGVGFEVSMSAMSLSELPEIGNAVSVRTYLHVTDAGISLFGFIDDQEKALFSQLIGVSGVGPKMALAALSTFTPKDLAAAISSQDIAKVSKIPGVGKKTASRIVLELKGSLDVSADLFNAGEVPGAPASAMSGAIEALLSMGFTQAEADLALKGAPDESTESSLLQYALKRLG